MCYACVSEALNQMLKLCVFLCVIMLFIYVQCTWKANVHACQIHHIFRHIIPYTFTPNPTHHPSLLSFYPHLHHPTVLRPVHNVPTERQACHFLAQDFKMDAPCRVSLKVVFSHYALHMEIRSHPMTIRFLMLLKCPYCICYV